MEHYWVLEGKEVRPTHDVFEWARMIESKNRIVQQTTVRGLGRQWVSTVFLGLNHRFFGSDDLPPLIFETMIFGGPHDQYADRYATWADAEAGHAYAVHLAAEARWDWRHWIAYWLSDIRSNFQRHCYSLGLPAY